MSIFNFFKLFFSSLRNYYEKHPVTNRAIQTFLKKKFKGIDLYTVDNMYLTCDYEDAKNIGNIINTKIAKYKEEEWDCDNFAWEFRAVAQKLFPRLPIGYTHVKKSDGSLHALNFIIYKSSEKSLGFMFIEPQNNKVSMFNYKPFMMIV